MPSPAIGGAKLAVLGDICRGFGAGSESGVGHVASFSKWVPMLGYSLTTFRAGTFLYGRRSSLQHIQIVHAANARWSRSGWQFRSTDPSVAATTALGVQTGGAAAAFMT